MNEMTRKRARTGCLNCREKHKKCDERKPSCDLCTKRNEKCEWPLRMGRFNKNSVRGITNIMKGSIDSSDGLENKKMDGHSSQLNDDNDEINKKRAKNGSHAPPRILNIERGNTVALKANEVTQRDDFESKSPGIFINVAPSIQSNLLVDRHVVKYPETIITNGGQKNSPLNFESVPSYQRVTSFENGNSMPIEHKDDLNEESSDTSYHSLSNGMSDNGQKSSKISLNSLLNSNSIKESTISFNAPHEGFPSNVSPHEAAHNEVEVEDITSRAGSNPENLASGVQIAHGASELDHYSSDGIKNNDTYSFSPESIMSPFMHHSNLNSTLRDYMFTNVVSAPDLNNDFIITARFNNILNGTVSNTVSRSTSNKNIKEYMNNEKEAVQKEEIKNIIRLNPKTNNVKQEKPILSNDEKLDLLKNYLYEVAPWLDMFDTSRQFGVKIPELAQKNEALLFSLYAISSRQKEQALPKHSSELTIKLYQESLNHLIPTVDQTMNKSITSSCVILCVFEMMSSSPKEWRHHLEGCCALFKANNINGFSDSLERALFWCYARMDVSSAVIGEQPTICASEYWLPKGYSVRDSKKLFLDFADEDVYANYIVFLCSRVLNLIADDTDSFKEEWELLWNEVVEWYVARPISLKQILEYEDKPFPGILFLNGPAISANQLYHMAIILLIQNKPRRFKINTSDSVRSTIWHAKQICAISIHNTHHGCWNNALQPLWIAGKLLSSDEEHEVILNLLEKIENTTGWQMRFRASDLKKYWNGSMAY